jgi:hypothetical protein
MWIVTFHSQTSTVNLYQKPQPNKIGSTQHAAQLRHVCSVNVPVIRDYFYE